LELNSQMKKNETIINVVAVDLDNKYITVQGSGFVSEPLVPAALYLVDRPDKEIIQLHKLITRKDDLLTFKSSSNAFTTIPKIGDKYIFRAWWTPDQLDLVKDKNRTWNYEEYPDDGSYEYCALSWEKISSSPDCENFGYRSEDVWLSTDAYKTYIIDDLLEIR